MKALNRLLQFIEEARGISQHTWDSYNIKEKKDYLKSHPKSKYKPKIKQWFEKVIPSIFKSTLLSAKQTQPPEVKWRVDDTHSLEDYEKDKLYITKGGSTVAVTKDGDIISVCGNRNDLYSGKDLLHQAVAKGGRKLDAYGMDLYYFYTKNGFKPISCTPFNKEYAPNDWKENYGHPNNLHVIFYIYDKDFKPTKSYEEFIERVNPCTGENGYVEAMAIRDNLLK